MTGSKWSLVLLEDGLLPWKQRRWIIGSVSVTVSSFNKINGKALLKGRGL